MTIQVAPASKQMLWRGRILSSLPVLVFVFRGMFSMLKPALAAQSFADYGYPDQKEVSQLQQQPGMDLVVLGGAKLASSLFEWELVDEYRVMVNPVLLGKGRPLFTGITERIRLKLEATKVLRSPVVILSYQRT